MQSWNLRTEMERLGATVKEMAQRSGLHHNTISKYRSQVLPPKRVKEEVLQNLCKALNEIAEERGISERVTPAQLMGLAPIRKQVEVKIPEMPGEVPHRRPQWLPLEEWEKYLAKWQQADGTLRCELTRQKWIQENRIFDFRDLPLASTIDHIIAKKHGGTDALENLQPATHEANQEKLIAADPFWGYDTNPNGFYDQTLDLSKLRVSQRQVAYDNILDIKEFWLQPRVLMSGNLLALLMVVRGGKLLGSTIALPFAINKVIRERYPLGAPRVKTVLVLTRETGLRDQFVSELKRQPTGFGITSSAPRVKCIEKADWLTTNHNHIRKNFDICVSCIQMFFAGQGDSAVPRKDMARLLSNFDLIVIDEPHWAFDQVRKIVQFATESWVVGTTGTPLVKGEEDPIPLTGDRDMGIYTLGSWTAEDADDHDGSLKYIAPIGDIDPVAIRSGEAFDWLTFDSNIVVVHDETGARDSEVLTLQGSNYEKGRPQGAGKNEAYSLQVCSAVLTILWDLDSLWRKEDTMTELAGHRQCKKGEEADGDGWEPSILYPPHALIVADGILNAEKLTAKINAKLDELRLSHPGKYRREEGWRAETVHGPSSVGFDGTSAEPIAAKPLSIPADPHADPEGIHPWLRSYLLHDGEKIDSGCARILVVDSMVREGVTNPLCNIVAWACAMDKSIHEGTQRGARCIGAFIKPPAEEGGKKRCPPRSLDIPLLVTHDVWSENRIRMVKALTYIRASDIYLQQIPSVQELLAGKTQSEAPTELEPLDSLLLRTEKVAIVEAIGGVEGSGVEHRDIWGAIASVTPAHNCDARVTEIGPAALAWAETVIDTPKKAETNLGYAAATRFPLATPILHERGKTTVEQDRLHNFLRIHHPDLWRVSLDAPAQFQPGGSLWAHSLSLWGEFQQRHSCYEGEKVTSLSKLQHSYADAALKEACGPNYKAICTQAQIGKASGMCMNIMKRAVGAPLEKNNFKNDGVWDVPAVHHILMNHRHEIVGAVIRRLIEARLPGTEKTARALDIPFSPYDPSN